MAIYARALELSPGNRAGWRALADLAAAGKLDDAEAKQASDLIQRLLFRSYPEFSLVIRLRMIKDRGMIEHAAGIAQMAELFRERPDLLVLVRLAEGDRQRADKKREAAMDTYLDVLRRNAQSGPVVMMVMPRLEEMLRESKDERRLLEILQQVLNAMPKLSACKHARSTPYFILGWKCVELMDELKESQAALQLRVRLENLVSRSAE